MSKKGREGLGAGAAKLKPAMSSSNCKVYHGDNLAILPQIKDSNISLVYIDPPFNTGKKQVYKKFKATHSDDGQVLGYNGKRYLMEEISRISYDDQFSNYLDFLGPRVKTASNLLTSNGSFFLHVDYRESHYCKIMMDEIFGRDNFMNEIIWSYDYGARSKKRWSAKHDNILWYVKDKNEYIFNFDAIDRIPYMAPNLVGNEKAKRGKTPTDVWWSSIIGTNSHERMAGEGYPTQKPLSIIERIILVHSNPGDTVLDFFAGSGTAGVGALKNNRKTILIDNKKVAIEIIKKRITTSEKKR